MKITNFIKQVFAVAIGFLVSFIFLLLIVIFTFSKSTLIKTEYKPKENSVLELNISGYIVEQVPSSLFGSSKGTIDLKVITKAIYQAMDDNHIKAIYLNLSQIRAGWPVLEEIRTALLTFKKKGKTIVAYGDCYSQKSYYLASLSDEIVLNPSGIFEFQGLSATVEFYTNLFKNIAVKPVIFRVGDYKSFVEPFCLNKMSEESRQQTKAYLDHIYEHFLTNIGLSRNITILKLKEYANNLSAVLPEDALSATLITKIGYAEQAKSMLKEQLFKINNSKDIHYVPYDKYYLALKEASASTSRNQVAVVVAEGEIIDGSSSFGYVGSRDFVKTMKTMEEDTSVKAVVLRINSPGGSVLASDVMWNSIESLKKVKPIVASMSSVAASGGYYIATPCHYIFAQPTTITGSIGIFGILFDTDELMRKIGIESDVVKTAPSADFLNPRTSCLEAESIIMFKMLQKNYDSFLHKVSVGRGLKLDQVEKLSSGRVFVGTEASKNGLLDELGNLEAAIEKAAALAELTGKYNICYVRPRTRLEELWNYTSSNLKMDLLSMISKEFPIVNHLQIMHRRKGVQAILPYSVDIK